MRTRGTITPFGVPQSVPPNLAKLSLHKPEVQAKDFAVSFASGLCPVSGAGIGRLTTVRFISLPGRQAHSTLTRSIAILPSTRATGSSGVWDWTSCQL